MNYVNTKFLRTELPRTEQQTASKAKKTPAAPSRPRITDQDTLSTTVDANGQLLSTALSAQLTPYDGRWSQMLDAVASVPEHSGVMSTHIRSRLWRQNYYLSALEAAGVVSFGQRELRWHLDDIARQLGECRPPSASTVQRWRRQMRLSRKEAFAQRAYFDQMRCGYTNRRHSWEAA